MKVLEKFYVGKVTNDALIEDDIKANLSDEMRGQWVTEQLFKAAVTLHVDSFVQPIDLGGSIIPVIQDIEHYEAAHMKLRELAMHGIEATLPMRRKAEERIRLQVEEADGWVDALMFNLAEVNGLDSPTTEDETSAAQMKAELERVTTVYDQRYAK